MDGAVAVEAIGTPASAAIARPYPPSVLDRLIYRIDRLPGHGWWVYPLALGVGLVWIHAWIWAWGVAPVGTFQPASWTYVFYVPFALASIHFLDRAGSAAMASFRPALDLTDAEVEARRYELVTLPAGPAIWLVVAAGLAIGIGVSTTQTDEALALFSPNRAAGLFIVLPFAVFGYMGFAALIWHTFRQLRLVTWLHREARLDLFDTGPIYAFSGLTMRTGLVWATVGYYSIAVNGAFVTTNPVALPISITNFIVAAACFVLPLYGLHGRLVLEKGRLLHEASARVAAIKSQLYARVDANQLPGIKDVTDAYNGVVAAREQVLKLPTWPWPPRAIGQFATALVLPIVIYVVSRLVGQQLGA